MPLDAEPSQVQCDLAAFQPPARFAAGLFRGTAGYYDRYRLPYPEAMITDLARTAQISGRGRLLDLACETGHGDALTETVTFACELARKPVRNREAWVTEPQLA